ncbi:MAG TPA: aspartyl protease family protein [Thermoanaerobaculia bacterium]|nr:aspartyl protease family protein [Thermoanaerobaculia bacterium]
MRTHLCFLLLFAALTASATEKPVATIPFRLVDNRIFIPVRINGHGPFPMLFDTGGRNLVHTHYAQRLQLDVADAGTSSGTGGGVVKRGRTMLREVQVGPIVMKDQPAVVMEAHDAAHVFGTFEFAGLVGRELMEAYVIRIDYQRRELTFFDKSYEYRGSGEIVVTDEAFDIPVIRGRIDGAEARLGLDTGARTSIVLYAGFLAEHRIRERYQPKFSGITGWGIGGPIRTDLARIDSVTLGTAQVRRPVARFTLMTTGLTTSNAISALIGPDLLKRFILIVDAPRNRVIFEQSSAFGAAEIYDRSGMWIGQEKDAFVVLDVMKGSPADAAGLMVDDRILAIDGKIAKRLLLPDVRERFRTDPEGTVIVMMTERGGKRVTRKLVVRDFLAG